MVRVYLWLIPSPVTLPLTQGQASTHDSASELTLSIQWKILSFSRAVVRNHTGVKHHRGSIWSGARSIVRPLKYFQSKFCLVNTSFQAVFVTAEALTPLRLLSPFTSSLYSSNSSSRTCKLPEINEYHAFHQAHAPQSFQYLKHTIVSKLWQLAGKEASRLMLCLVMLPAHFCISCKTSSGVCAAAECTRNSTEGKRKPILSFADYKFSQQGGIHAS